MIYGNESIAHFSRSNMCIWMSMAFQAGLINIGGFLACHRFVSHVTGFATFFGYEVSEHRVEHALGMLTVPLFFLFGAMLSGQLVDIRLKLHKKPKYYIVFGLIFLMLLSVSIGGHLHLFGTFGEPLESAHSYFLLAILCLACGLQNGAITAVSKSVVRTTHLTGITTDLGVGLVRVLNRKKLGAEISNEFRSNLMRAGIIFFFGFGSVLGGFAFKKHGYAGFLIPSATSGILFSIMLYFQVLKKEEAAPK